MRNIIFHKIQMNCLDFFWVYVAYIFVVQKRKNIYAYIIKKQIILRKIIR